MTKTQLTDLFNWNKVRGTLDRPLSMAVEVRMLLEEQDEFTTAETIHDKLDALADIIVVASGTLFKLGLSTMEIYLRLGRSTIPQCAEYSPPFDLNSLQCSANEWENVALDLISWCEAGISCLGYNCEMVLNETIKEISSRKGEIINGKFTKFTDDYHKSLWYAADYTRAKLC